MQAKQMWAELSAEQKKTYGEDYYEAAMSSVDKYSKEVRQTGINFYNYVNILKYFYRPLIFNLLCVFLLMLSPVPSPWLAILQSPPRKKFKSSWLNIWLLPYMKFCMVLQSLKFLMKFFQHNFGLCLT